MGCGRSSFVAVSSTLLTHFHHAVPTDQNPNQYPYHPQNGTRRCWALSHRSRTSGMRQRSAGPYSLVGDTDDSIDDMLYQFEHQPICRVQLRKISIISAYLGLIANWQLPQAQSRPRSPSNPSLQFLAARARTRPSSRDE